MLGKAVRAGRGVLDLPGRIIGRLTENNSGEYPYELSIVVVVKNEEDYIDEWIRYHQLVGIDHIYLYNNGSTDKTEKIVRPYVENGFVTYTSMTGTGVQLAVYNDAIKRFKDETKYMAFIDADEFLRSVNVKLSLIKSIENIFDKDRKAAGIGVNWRMFGSSGFVDKPQQGGVLENFVYRAAPGKPGNDCIKTIANPRKIYRYRHPHYPIYNIGHYSIDEKGRRSRGWKNSIPEPQEICINHYFTKSREEWVKRRSLGRVDSKKPNDTRGRTLDDFLAHDNNDIYDNTMIYYVNQM